jgi:hypothetical protein
MKNFSKIFLPVASLAIATTASAQNVLEQPFTRDTERTEIIIPKVNGLNVYKSDLHLHTIYSDGDVTPEMRVIEAWQDGLDIIAITDHMEYRRIEREMFKYMKDYIREDLRSGKAVNTNVLKTDPDAHGLLVDFNIAPELAIRKARDYGIFVIKGVEITRSNLGDYNALFTTDNNKIYDPDIRKAIKNAVDQGAFVFQNHPKRDPNTKTKMTELAEEMYAKGYLKGTELGNGHAFWGWLVPHCLNNGLAPISNSDGHATMAERFYPFYNKDAYRNMTFILAKKCDEKSIKDALFAGRTIAYHSNKLVGKEEYLCEFFKNSVTIEHQCDTKKSTIVTLTNRCSIPFELKWGKNSTAVLGAMGALQIHLPKGAGEQEFVVTNLITGGKKRAKVTLSFKRKPDNEYLKAEPNRWYPY